ncbi:hypothetical protein GALMADRAFT_205009 [Galerina marginata CBS 339.88]|uniref:Uncharacterized protein n=1 Tax=Galerina marginata (strain CBS 339.88) TaxID=685588 RepID=A0A067U2K4_GALM3|nr:hypothetical protein GALMADRAFT_205009 [Galerina marginata CBS 339.88]
MYPIIRNLVWKVPFIQSSSFHLPETWPSEVPSFGTIATQASMLGIESLRRSATNETMVAVGGNIFASSILLPQDEQLKRSLELLFPMSNFAAWASRVYDAVILSVVGLKDPQKERMPESTGITRLNEYLQKKGRLTSLSWQESWAGPANSKKWTMTCKIPDFLEKRHLEAITFTGKKGCGASDRLCAHYSATGCLTALCASRFLMGQATSVFSFAFPKIQIMNPTNPVQWYFI